MALQVNYFYYMSFEEEHGLGDKTKAKITAKYKSLRSGKSKQKQHDEAMSGKYEIAKKMSVKSDENTRTGFYRDMRPKDSKEVSHLKAETQYKHSKSTLTGKPYWSSHKKG